MKFYVYVLIDPSRDNQVFYVGKGTGRRPNAHLNAEPNDSPEIGADRDCLWEASQQSLEVTKASYVARLVKEHGYRATDLIRVVARELDQEMALTIESFLIKFAYAASQLTNIVAGKHAHRFRVHADWRNYQFHQPELQGSYVYALRDPGTGDIFYVGKGIGKRAISHFKEATRKKNESEFGAKTERILDLLNSHEPEDVARVIAQGLTSDEAIAIESLAIKFLYGISGTTNEVRGHKAGRFRSDGDWRVLKGFDLPFIVYSKNGRMIRKLEMDDLLGQGLDSMLYAVLSLCPELQWTDTPVLADSGDLSMYASIPMPDLPKPLRIKIFTRGKGVQVEMRGSSNAGCLWIRDHAINLGSSNRRMDDAFFPDAWVRNLAKTPEEAARRVRLLSSWATSMSREELVARIGEADAFELLNRFL